MSLISVEALFILYALQSKVAAPIPLLSAQELRHRRVLTWTSFLTLVCIVNVILRWAPAQEKWHYLIGLSPVYLSYAVVVLRLYRGKFRNGLNLAIAMGCAFGIAGVFLIRYVIRWEKVWWILGNLVVATLMQTVLVVVATKALIGMPRSTKWGIKSLGSLAYGTLLFGIFWLWYSPVPSFITDKEFFAMDFMHQCSRELLHYSLQHDGQFPAELVASGSDSKCTTAVPFQFIGDAAFVAWQANPMNPINGYFLKYSGKDTSLTKDGCIRYKRFTITARPVDYGQTGIRSFLLDCKVHVLMGCNMELQVTSENRPANPSDPIVWTLEDDFSQHRP